MSRNFFKEKCQTITDKAVFGLCDKTPPPHLPAYIDTENPDSWIAEVNNENEYEVTFIAVDNCIYKSTESHAGKRCDAILLYNSDIIFVELKVSDLKNSKWIPGAEEQVKSTIYLFSDSHDLSIYENKTAYLANSMRPYFQSGQQARMNRFEDETGVQLLIQSTIELL
jgi:hypothetical protein